MTDDAIELMATALAERCVITTRRGKVRIRCPEQPLLLTHAFPVTVDVLGNTSSDRGFDELTAMIRDIIIVAIHQAIVHEVFRGVAYDIRRPRPGGKAVAS